MIKFVRKRDGIVVPFDATKITNAVKKACKATNKGCYKYIADDISSSVVKYFEAFEDETVDVETIQDCIEEILMTSGFASTAKAFILYRNERTKVREGKTHLMKTFEDIVYSDAEDSDTKRENANVDGNTAMGMMLKFGSEGVKQFCITHMLKPEHAKAHEEGDIHIHDLDFYPMTVTCCQIDLQKLFKDGFTTGHGVLREPQDIQSYAALACIAIQSNQNDMHKFLCL